MTPVAALLMAKARSSLLPEYSWDNTIGRYRNVSTGRLVARTEIRSAVDTVVANSQRRMAEIATSYQQGTITLGEFWQGMGAAVKRINVASAVAANGGFANMTQSDWGQAGQHIRAQYGYLERWVYNLASGNAPEDGRLVVRAQMYANGARELYERAYRSDQTNYGNAEERGVLHAQESCDDCVARADMGWVPLGTLPAIGDSQCDGNCMCTMDFRKAEAVAISP